MGRGKVLVNRINATDRISVPNSPSRVIFPRITDFQEKSQSRLESI